MQVMTQNDPTAVMGRRIAAYLIDGIIVFAIWLVAFLAMAETDVFAVDADTGEKLEEVFGSNPDGSQFQWNFTEALGGYVNIDGNELDLAFVEGGSFWAVTLIGLAGSVGFLVLMQGATGKTPGKAMVGITTVDEAGQPPGIGKAIVRWLLLFVDSFFILPGLITSLVSKGHRRIGDMAAGTYVIRSAAVGQPVTIGGAGMPQGQQQYPAYQQPVPQQPAADAQWDPSRQAWIRWDGNAWQQHDPAVPGGWRPIS